MIKTDYKHTCYACYLGYITQAVINNLAPLLFLTFHDAFGIELALAGDLGCSSGPTLVGFVSGAAGDNLKSGLLAAIVFPVIMLICCGIFKRIKNDSKI